MSNLYLRFLLVMVLGSPLTWVILKYLISRYHDEYKAKPIDLIVAVVAATPTFGFIGIVLVDGTSYAESAVFSWGVPLLFGVILGTLACHQLFVVRGTGTDDKAD